MYYKPKLHILSAEFYLEYPIKVKMTNQLRLPEEFYSLVIGRAKCEVFTWWNNGDFVSWDFGSVNEEKILEIIPCFS